MLRKKLYLLGFLIFTQDISFAKEFLKTCPPVRETVNLLLQMEFFGRRSLEYNGCLKGLSSDVVWVRPEQNDDSLNVSPNVDGWIETNSDFSLDEIRPLNFPERYDVKFSYKIDGQKFSDEMQIDTFEGNTKKMVGCGGIVTPPKKMILFKSCQKFKRP